MDYARKSQTTVRSADKAERHKYWATTFRALGDIVHLVEDMAQPQHTRNDPHSGVLGFGHASIYESYIDCRVTGEVTESIFNAAYNAGAKSCALLEDKDYGSYSPPRFVNYGDFFSSQEGLAGKGLADYSNRGFFSAGTNLGSNRYSAPSNNASSYIHEQVALTTVDKGYQTILAPLSILKADVPDTLPGGQPATAVPLTTEGMWYQPLAEFSTPANAQAYGYTLTRPNYDAMASLLIPRAVAYSAGLLDYFFRGKIEAQDAGFTDTGVILRVKNAIDTKKQPAWMNENLANGATLHVTLQYDVPGGSDPSGTITTYRTSGAVTLTEDIKPGQASFKAYTFTMTDPAIPDNATQVQYRLVYRGRLGREDDAVCLAQNSIHSPRIEHSSRRIA